MTLVPLSELLDLSDSGVWGDEDAENGISVLRSTNFNSNGTLDLNKLTFRVLDERDRRRKLLQPGDILLEKSGGGPKQPVGRVCLYRGDGQPHAFGNFIARLRPRKDIVSEYLFYFLWQFHSAGKTSHYQKQTTGIRNLELKRYLGISVPLVSHDEQRRIVDLLSRAEGIVRLRREARAKAQAIIPALFIDMFGDPAANPRGWDKLSLGDLCTRITDGTHQPPKFQASGVPFIFVANIVSGELNLATEKFISEETYVELTRRCPVDRGDVLYSTVGSFGVPVKVDTESRFCFQRHIAHLKPNAHVLDTDFLVGMLMTPALKAQAVSAARGIAQKTVNLGEIRKFQVIAPPLAAQRRFASHVAAMRSIQALHASALVVAEATFQSLLARAFSGEHAAAASVEEAAVA